MIKVSIYITIIVPIEFLNSHNTPILRLEPIEKEYEVCPQIGDMIEIFEDGILETVESRYITNKGIEIPIKGLYKDLTYYQEGINEYNSNKNT